MIFRSPHTNDESSVPTNIIEMVLQAMAMFNSKDEVRFAEDEEILPVVCNLLTARQDKFYLIHLPSGAGWVLRRTRPTGQFYGIPTPDGGLSVEDVERAAREA